MNAASSSRLQDQDNPIKDGKAEIMAGMDVVQLNVVNPRYNIIGAEMQVVNIELKPGDSVEVSPGAMMHHGPNIYASPNCSCSCGRYCTGESNVRIEFENKGSVNETIGLTPVYPAKIIPVHLNDSGAVIVRQRSYMCGVGDVNISVSLDCCTMTSLCSGMGSIRQKISGSGVAFLQAGGTVLEKTLKPGEMIIVDQESLVGWSETVTLGVRSFAGMCGCCSIIYGGEGCCMATLTGGAEPGKIYITSMNYSKWHRVLNPGITGSGQKEQHEAPE